METHSSLTHGVCEPNIIKIKHVFYPESRFIIAIIVLCNIQELKDRPTSNSMDIHETVKQSLTYLKNLFRISFCPLVKSRVRRQSLPMMNHRWLSLIMNHHWSSWNHHWWCWVGDKWPITGKNEEWQFHSISPLCPCSYSPTRTLAPNC